jgi:phosphatidate cytidylyltransferase
MVRIASAAVLLGVVILTVWVLPPWVTAALAAFAAALGAAELAGLSAKLGAAVPPVYLGGAAAIVAVAFVADAAFAMGMRGALASVLVALVVTTGAITLALGPPAASTVQRAAVALMGPIYLGVPMGALAWLRVARGPEALTLLIVVIAVSDSAQYYTGRLVGRRKLAPTVSPAKTVEGAIGGLAAAAIVGATLGAYWLIGVGAVEGAIVGLVLSAVGIIGDLFESLLKRGAGVKDSSTLIPGHGGILDRVDSYLFAAPVFYLFLRHIA